VTPLCPGTAHVVAALSANVHDIRCSTAVASVRPGGGSGNDAMPSLQLRGSGQWQHFDAIIMATPPTVSAALLNPAVNSSSSSSSGSNDGISSGLSLSRVLQGFKSEGSKLVLHTDSTTMPADVSLWSSVNFLLVSSSPAQASAASASSAASSRPYSATAYDAQACIWLNAAQKQSTSSLQRQLFQTWNPVTPISPEHVLTSSEFQRPLCSIPSVQLLKPLWSQQGVGGVFVCGSYCMHAMPLLESAVTSALEVTGGMLGAALPWPREECCLYKDIDFKMKNCRLDFRILPYSSFFSGTLAAAAVPPPPLLTTIPLLCIKNMSCAGACCCSSLLQAAALKVAIIIMIIIVFDDDDCDDYDADDDDDDDYDGDDDDGGGGDVIIMMMVVITSLARLYTPPRPCSRAQ
jgi:hypothetical protein